MGTDIHMVVQRKTDGGWEGIEFPDHLHPNWLKGLGPDTVSRYEWFIDRNYHLFAMLADVRNGYCFAGIETTAAPLTPISLPRGFPEDFQVEKGKHAGVNMGEYGFSWLSLRELLEYDWSRTFLSYGVVSYETWLELRKNPAKPSTYSAGVFGGDVLLVLEEAIVDADNPPEGTTHVRMVWEESYREAARDFCEEVIPELQRHGAPEDVRIVFGFDS